MVNKGMPNYEQWGAPAEFTWIYIIAPSKPLDAEPIENAVAFLDAVQNQGT